MDAAAVFLRQSTPPIIRRRWEKPVRRSSDSCLGIGARRFPPSQGLPQWPAFACGNRHQHIQRRYRPGFTPGYLVQHPRFTAGNTTKWIIKLSRLFYHSPGRLSTRGFENVGRGHDPVEAPTGLSFNLVLPNYQICHPERNAMEPRDLRSIDGAKILRLAMLAQDDISEELAPVLPCYYR